ncbi:MAG: hypothetical protein WC667_00520 [Sulfurimonas sp.]|jgi:hypothetical protein
MNRINPLHIGVLLVVILIFFAYKLSSVKSELTEARDSYKETKEISLRLSGLKEVYEDKDKVEKALKRILEQPSLSTAKIEQEKKSTGIIISSKDMDLDAINSLMSKLLNGLYSIKTVEIKKLSPTNASLVMEITW